MWMKRPSGPTFSLTEVRKAMMSCLTTFSMASTRSASNPALARIVCSDLAGMRPSRAQASQTASSTSSQFR